MRVPPAARRSRIIAGLLTVAALALGAQPVRAQTPTPPPRPAAPARAKGPAPTEAQTVDEGALIQPGQHAHIFKTTIARKSAQLNYLLYLPESYGKDPFATYPLILFLHGSQESGRSINRVRGAVLPKRLEGEKDFPAIVVSPQASGFGWFGSTAAISALLDDLQSQLAIDPDRIYLTGMSMGAYGAWYLALKDQDRFAAIVSVVGGHLYPAKQLCPLKDIPVWVFTSKKDRNVDPKESFAVVNALTACGGVPKFTVYDNYTHAQAWQHAYDEPGLFPWLLEQRKPSVGRNTRVSPRRSRGTSPTICACSHSQTTSY